MSERVLIIEDEKNLGDTLSEYLSALGYECALAKDCKSARERFRELSPEVILIDIGLPDGNGLELAAEFRRERKDFVLFFLSAQNDPEIRVQGLEIGAEDYITKPFALKELTLRLKRVFAGRKEMSVLPEEIIHGPLKIHFSRYEVTDAEGQAIALNQKECAILKLLYEKTGEVVTREEVIDRIWGEDKYPSQRTVDNYIVTLRKWCETDPKHHLEIQSVRGVGYKLIARNI